MFILGLLKEQRQEEKDRCGGKVASRLSSSQTSYLSQIIFVEKNLSCGEISDFCKEFEQFMEFC